VIYRCDHCGRFAGDEAGGSSMVSDHTDRVLRLCHRPTEPDRPDCYHLVTVAEEPIGIRKTPERS
jgi:hypothetical protein